MNSILDERIRMVIAKIEIAFGYSTQRKAYKNEIDFPRLKKIIEDFEQELVIESNLEDGEEDTPLELLSLPAEIVTRLSRFGILSIEELEQMSDEELIKVKGINRIRIDQIDQALAMNGKKRV